MINKRIFVLVLACVSALLFSPGALLAESPAGIWKAGYNTGGAAVESYVELYEENGLYYGKIRNLINAPEPNPVCKNCPGGFNNTPVIGLRIIWNMKKTGENVYSGGYILNPFNGKIDTAEIIVEDNTTLKVRSYTGRYHKTQIWKKAG